ncbi:hypothetical protein [Methanobrevibacter arboriphilus]|uniref:Uncharacterized protein n=1 Tax=Methanobrevibacter arboriphilus TaxID=39441 RepID=A0ACA8R1T7_METAZ|nr:hypothetical protein [Methanobrevibacter arboriphilus]BBL61526.1 hypothetical protein MarbSA_05660 [Methanobrevibacter arboriphilus]
MAVCKFCGSEFDKKHNRQMYCNEYCSKEGEKENRRKRRSKYYHRYKNVMHEETKYGLGSGFLSMHRHEEDIKELIAVENEMRRLKIKA